MKHTPYIANLSSGDHGPGAGGQAKCSTLPPAVIDALFFGDQGISSNPARRFCLGIDGGPRCPILERCRELGADEKHGTWGALSPEERAMVRLGRDLPPQLECGHLDVPTNIRITENGSRICRYCYPKNGGPVQPGGGKGRPRQNSEQHEAIYGHPLQITAAGRKCLVCDRNRKRRYKGLPANVLLPLGRPRKETAA